jgi:hypothetical protein
MYITFANRSVIRRLQVKVARGVKRVGFWLEEEEEA